ncbi:hypothetical protein [Streptococcus oralis]|jgi:hypothetical protein|uniref:hypothetical protein n=1 Tax=Streptococcus oralis TaxID=1303 RepID=UPI000A11AD74|nr:hypothetical protein [Streptococcus oralis]MCY7090571.1 hypothetical protein [Streptococcus oralis]ORO81386.1 hypothetical protein B7706_06710 [Streptococcus oralis subsp. dentisani]ORO82336.1 hypothetical protein B7704_07960 [Streptococcus oralis subsp. dentisani]
MSEELEIQVLAKSERFNEKKEALKAFSEEIPEQSDLPTVPQDDPMLGFIGMEYDVKGKDLNALTDAVQNRMIEQNKHIKKIIQEFNTIYETFQILDDEYIQSISKSLIAAKEANSKAIQGLHEIEEYQTGNKKLLDDVFKQNKDLIDILKKHHKKLEELEQLEDKQSEIQIEIDSLKAKLKTLVKIENSFNDLHLQVEETQNDLKNAVDKMNVRLIEEGKNLTLTVEKFQIKLEEKQKEISFLRKGFYTLGILFVLIVLFLLFKGM